MMERTFTVAGRATRVGWVVVGIALAAVRLAGVKSPAFQALAHLAVGGWLGAWLYGRAGFYGWLALALSLVETYAFLTGIGKAAGR